MSNEKISDTKKQYIAKLNLKGNDFKNLAPVVGVCETTLRKAHRIGGYLNKINELEKSNRQKDIQIQLYQMQVQQNRLKKVSH